MALLGIISDTHDNRPLIGKAVEIFNSRGVGLVVHAGDFIAPFVARDFRALKCPLVGAFGNNDGERKGLLRAFEGIGEIHQGPHTFAHEGRRIAVMHEPDRLEEFLKPEYDLVVYGHTHKAEVREGRPLVVNPGEVGGWLYGRSTVVILDLDDMRAEVIEL